VSFYEIIAKRRSVRKFKEKNVPKKVLLRILDAGRWAPSAGNTQPWHFIVVTDANIKRRLAKVYTELAVRLGLNFLQNVLVIWQLEAVHGTSLTWQKFPSCLLFVFLFLKR